MDDLGSLPSESARRVEPQGVEAMSTTGNYFDKRSIGVLIMATKPGLYANIHAKRERIATGSGEKMRKPGTAGAPTEKSFKESAKTAKPKK